MKKVSYVFIVFISFMLLTGCTSTDQTEPEETKQSAHDLIDEIEADWEKEQATERIKEQAIAEQQADLDKEREENTVETKDMLQYIEDVFEYQVGALYIVNYNVITIEPQDSDIGQYYLDTLVGKVDKRTWQPFFRQLDQISLYVSDQLNDPDIAIAYLRPQPGATLHNALYITKNGVEQHNAFSQ